MDLVLSKLFFFASISCYVLGTGSAKPITKSKVDLVQESIEEHLTRYSNDSEKIKYLIQKMAKDRVSHKEELLDEVAKISAQWARETARKGVFNEIIADAKISDKEAERAKKVMNIVIHARLTSKMLRDLERFAFPFVLYNERSLNRYKKWMIALLTYTNPILDEIREELERSNLDYEDFANAADDVHSLISEKLALPLQRWYKLPTKQQDIKNLCNFLDFANLDENPPAVPRQPGTETESTSHATPQCTRSTNDRNKNKVDPRRQAAKLACWMAFEHRGPAIDREVAKEISNAGVKWYSATIIIQNVDFEMYPAIENSLDMIIKGETYKDVVRKLASKRILHPNTWDTESSGELDIVFHLVCKPALDIENDPSKKIQGELGKQFPGKKITLLTTYTVFALGADDYTRKGRSWS